MMIPLEPGLIAHRDARDGKFANVVGEGCARADGAQEGVPAVGDGRGMEKSQVEGDEGTGGSAFLDALDDGGFFGGGCGRRVGNVRELHGGVCVKIK